MQRERNADFRVNPADGFAGGHDYQPIWPIRFRMIAL